MYFKARSNNITRVLYTVLALCIISIMILSIYSVFNQKDIQDNKDRLNSLNLNSAESNALNNNIIYEDGDSEEAIMDFFRKKTTEAITEPITQAPTQKPTERLTEPVITTESPPPPPPPTMAVIPEQDIPDIKINPAVEAAEDSVQVINLSALYIKPAAGYMSKKHNPDKPEYSVTMNDYRTHMGIDIDSEVGINVKAISDGIISNIYDNPLMGKTIVIDHSDNIQSIYMNLQENLPKNITIGTKVKGGEVIGGVGETALIEISDVPHLHLEMKKDGKYIDPLDYIKY